MNKLSFEELTLKAVKEMKEKECMYPGCSNAAIKSHALQNNGVLSRLAVNGHVLMPYAQRDLPFPEKDKRLFSRLNNIGKNEATTFYGFCKEHDDELFSYIEKQNYPFNGETAFLFAYRTLCSQLRNKEELERRMEKEDKFFNASSDLIIKPHKLFITDFQRSKRLMDNFLLHKTSKNPVSFMFWHLNKISFASEGAIFPLYDFSGKAIRKDYKPEKGKPLFIIIIPYKNKSIAIISWLKKDGKKLRRYISTLRKLDLNTKEQYLTNFCLSSSDDIVFSPKIGNKISPPEDIFNIEVGYYQIQEKLEHRYRNSSFMLKDLGMNLFNY